MTMTTKASVFLSGAALSTAMAAALPVKAQTILFNNFLPPNDVLNQGVVQPWLADIERVTEGRVRVVQPTATLAPPPELLTMVQQGIADGAFVMVGFLENSNPSYQISLLPGMAPGAEAASVAGWRTYQEHFAGIDELDGVELLGVVSVPGGAIYNGGSTPFASIADMANAKMWALPGLSSRVLGAMGTVVTPGPAVRMYEVVSGGVVDAFCCVNFESIEVFNVDQFVGAVTEVPGGIFSPTFTYFIASETWEQISAEDQEAIRSISGEVMARRAAHMDVLNLEARDRYIASGRPVIMASEAFQDEMQQVWAPIEAEWVASAAARGVDGEAALEFYRAELDRVMAGE